MSLCNVNTSCMVQCSHRVGIRIRVRTESVSVNVNEPLLPPANEVCEGYVSTCVCLSTGWGVVSQHALQVVSQHTLHQVSRGVVCQHALQISMPTPGEGGSWRESGRGWSPGPHPRGKLRDLARGVSRPTPRGVYPIMHWGRPPPTATAGGCTYPTGMHSCILIVPYTKTRKHSSKMRTACLETVRASVSVATTRQRPQTETPPDRDIPKQRPPWTETPSEQRHPRTVRSGRYASYWNAFLLTILFLFSHALILTLISC